ncbi:iron-siderophore ABC transporter substrate-binding protein [Bailinhaonella thermotolerans]|uniref:Iron-siderophore ABC transporter substrate-binding protein n=1 Tax=Bailinhaonella thermotolerans TaxID=1070861 RepID=A0A3A4AKD7_9ACTN|nr:iron-siderophore ABC transporter substrate-binding protein [Bailinhaonella thermotolerans]RJL30116.1 iron-siderophore ABC transporter substrate-binding protein [Bailinhaonella thermotolerans]
MKPLRGAIVTLAALLTLAACGTTEPPKDAAQEAGKPSAAGAGPVTVTDSRGKAIKLDKPASRVVTLEWAETEMLASLGVQPVGAADLKGFAVWDTAVKLDPSVKDVGTRVEPSVDSIVALQPDLVIMESVRDAALVDQLEKTVPVLVTKASDGKDNLGRLRADFKMVAAAVGKTAEADKVLADLDKTLAEGKQKLAAAGAAGKPFIMADGWKENSNISIRLFGKHALVSEVAEQLGLVNAWTGKVDPMWGLGNTDVEGLTVLKDENIRFFYNASDNDDVFTGGLAGNAIWKSLPFVKKQQVTRLPDGIWTFGGPLSCKQYAEALLKAYGA